MYMRSELNFPNDGKPPRLALPAILASSRRWSRGTASAAVSALLACASYKLRAGRPELLHVGLEVRLRHAASQVVAQTQLCLVLLPTLELLEPAWRRQLQGALSLVNVLEVHAGPVGALSLQDGRVHADENFKGLAGARTVI